MAKRPGNISKMINRVESRIVGIEEADPYLKILVYARHGKGKTRFIATAPNVLIIDINEKGTKSARKMRGAKVFPVRRWEDIRYAYWFLKHGNHKFQSVAIDGLTAMQHMCMRHVLKETEDRDPNRPPNMPDRRVWGILAEELKPLIWDFRNLDMHVLFTARERTFGDPEEGEEVQHVPDLSPGSRGEALAAVDVIGRMYQRERRVVKGKKESKVWETRMLVGEHEQYETKNRVSSLTMGRIVSNPTVPKFLTAMKEES